GARMPEEGPFISRLIAGSQDTLIVCQRRERERLETLLLLPQFPDRLARVGIDDQQAKVQAPRALAGAKRDESAIGGNKAWGKEGRTDHGGLLMDLARRAQRPVGPNIHAIEHEPFTVKGNEGQQVTGPAALQTKKGIGRQIWGTIFGSTPLK